MPIPKNIKLRDLVGKDVVLDSAVSTAQCLRVQAGTVMRVSSVGRGLNLVSGSMPGCPVSFVLTDVRKGDVSLADDPDAPEPYYGALWTNRIEYNDFLWTECSRCGKQVEMHKTVYTGIDGRRYLGVKMPFCPRCGSRMGVRTPSGKITVGKDLGDRYGIKSFRA